MLERNLDYESKVIKQEINHELIRKEREKSLITTEF